MPGGGGNWLNYLIWCHLNNRNIPGDHLNFHLDTLSSIDPEYGYLIRCWFHTEPWRSGDIGFGSHRASLNIWMNNCRKLGHASTHKELVRQAFNYQDQYDWTVVYNIQWHLIVTDPKFMLECLNDSLGLKLSYTLPVQEAFQQYRNSCWPVELQGDNWKEHYLTKAWIDALKYRGVSEDEVYNHWTPYYPSNESI